MLRDSHLVLEGLFAVVAVQFHSVRRVDLDVLGVVTGVREGLIAVCTLVRFIANMPIGVRPILILPGEHLPTQFTAEAVEVRVVLGVHRAVSLQIVTPFEVLATYGAYVRLLDRVHLLIMPPNVLVEVARGDERILATVEGTFERPDPRVDSNVTGKIPCLIERSTTMRTAPSFQILVNNIHVVLDRLAFFENGFANNTRE